MSQHTPGPWSVGNARIWGATQEIAHVKRVRTTGDYAAVVRSTTEQEANARLIAAAPDLLDACGRARNYLLSSGDGKSHCVEILEAAIAKATDPETAPELLEACELAARILARDGIQIQRGLAYTGWRSGLIAAAIARATVETE